MNFQPPIINLNYTDSDSEVNISENFERHTATVTLKWIQNDLQALNSYYNIIVSVTPLTQVRSIINDGTTSVLVNISYNVVYDLTVVIRGNHCIENETLLSQSFYYREYYGYISTRFYL